MSMNSTDRNGCATDIKKKTPQKTNKQKTPQKPTLSKTKIKTCQKQT